MGFPIDRIPTGPGQYKTVDVPDYNEVTAHDLYRRTYIGKDQINPRTKLRRKPVIMHLRHRKMGETVINDEQVVGWLDEVVVGGRSNWNYRPHQEVRKQQAPPAATTTTEAPPETSAVPAEAAAPEAAAPAN